MTYKVKKRNGNLVPFDISRIENAIQKAFLSCKVSVTEDIIKNIAADVKVWDEIGVEDIQDQIEELLMDYDYPQVAKEFILYRNKRTVIRNQESKLIKKISEKLEAKSVENQNANVDEYSFGGRIGEASRLVNKEYALNYCMTEMAKNNHLNNEIYIHE